MMTGVVKQLFIDTNILVYANVSSAPQHAAALNALTQYRQTGVELWLSRQVLREYLAVLSRPQTFTAPLLPTDLTTQVHAFESHFFLAEDGPTVTVCLLELLLQLSVGGKQIHDANIVATMLAHGLTHLLTHNTADFARYAHLITLHSLDVATP